MGREIPRPSTASRTQRCSQSHSSGQCIAHCLKMPGSRPMTGHREAPALALTDQMTLEPRRVVRKASLTLDRSWTLRSAFGEVLALVPAGCLIGRPRRRFYFNPSGWLRAGARFGPPDTCHQTASARVFPGEPSTARFLPLGAVLGACCRHSHLNALTLTFSESQLRRCTLETTATLCKRPHMIARRSQPASHD